MQVTLPRRCAFPTIHPQEFRRYCHRTTHPSKGQFCRRCHCHLLHCLHRKCSFDHRCLFLRVAFGTMSMQINCTLDWQCTGILKIPTLDSCWEANSAYPYSLVSRTCGHDGLVRVTMQVEAVSTGSCPLSIRENESMVMLCSARWNTKLSETHGSGLLV